MSYDVFAQFYDSLTVNIDYKERARYISGIMEKYKPGCSLVVDLACGTGSLSVELAALGYDMIGVDSSPDMLSCAREKSGNFSILYLCQSMQKLDLYGTVDAVVCALDSVNHITDENVLAQAFSRVSLFLEQDGVFIFDANTLYKHETVLGDNAYIYDTDDVFCAWQNKYLGGGKTEISLDFFIPDENESYSRAQECFMEKAYSHAQLEKMLADCGMKICEEFDDYTPDAPGDKTQRIVYVCRKTGA